MELNADRQANSFRQMPSAQVDADRVELYIVPYKAEHYMSIENGINLFGEVKEFLSKQYLRGPAYTMFAGKEIVGCAGVMILWSGVGEAWAIATPIARKYPIYIVKTVRKVIDIIMKSMKLERMQAVVDKENKVGQKFTRKLGFEEEGAMKKYLAGRTYIRYSITCLPVRGQVGEGE